MSRRAGIGGCRRYNEASGRLTATTPAAAIAAIPASEMCSRWSALSAPISAASSAPPQLLSWSACSLAASPARRPAVRILRACDAAECGLFHEDITAGGELFLPHRRNYPFDQERHIPFGIALELGRYNMRSEERAHDPHRLLRGQPAVYTEQLELGIQVEAVTALALDSRDAQCQHLFQEAGGSKGELLLARYPGMTHGRGDATTAPGDLEIAAADDTLLELVCSPASEREMCVTVDQSGDHKSPAGIEPLCAMKFRGQLSLGTNPSDRTVVPGQGRIGNGVNVALPAFRAAGGQLTNVVQNLHVPVTLAEILRSAGDGEPP